MGEYLQVEHKLVQSLRALRVTQYFELGFVQALEVLMDLRGQELETVLDWLNFSDHHLDHFQGVCLSMKLLDDQGLFDKDWMHELNYLLFESLTREPDTPEDPCVINVQLVLGLQLLGI